jgi:hypothetical protein
MLIIDLPVNADFQAEAQMQDYYPEEVLNAGWNPVLEEAHTLQARMATPAKLSNDAIDPDWSPLKEKKLA